jgi:hypothetical protein
MDHLIFIMGGVRGDENPGKQPSGSRPEEEG